MKKYVKIMIRTAAFSPGWMLMLLTVMYAQAGELPVTARARTQTSPVSARIREAAPALPSIPLSAGLVRYLYGFPDGSIRANEKLTQAQAAMMLYLLAFDADKQDFINTGESVWYAKAVNYLQYKGVMAVSGEDAFRPDEPINGAAFEVLLTRAGLTEKIWPIIPPETVTRAEAAAIINKTLSREFDLSESVLLPSYSDLQPGDAFYEDIIRASLP